MNLDSQITLEEVAVLKKMKPSIEIQDQRESNTPFNMRGADGTD